MGKSVGVTQGLLESDASFQKRTETAYAAKMGLTQGWFESDEAFSKRVHDEMAKKL